MLGFLIVTGVLVAELAGRRHQFAAALHAAPLWVLGMAALLSIVGLLARTEAWYLCVRAAGATVQRRLMFRAAGVGYLASVLNGSLGVAARITSLRRSAPGSTPRVPALVAAEIPIITVEVALVAIFSFTLISPLHLPWWIPIIAVLVTGSAVIALRRFSQRHRAGLWAGLAAMHSGRARMVALVLVNVCVQIARNWLVLRAIGVHVSVFDAMALLIATFTLGQLPIGPSLGAAATVLILGSHGVAATAAAGVMLTVTGTVGSLCYASWAIADRVLAGRSGVAAEVAVAPIRA
ncbi:MAG TPA: lysylphosphatidylglycerol synthase domain-containing protein [Solirubrobacteraceae bacterium]|nr:lysylphosphatidylglycerol synthase domain-containing protein [Solirubrobacteraceae bacterium]